MACSGALLLEDNRCFDGDEANFLAVILADSHALEKLGDNDALKFASDICKELKASTEEA